MLPERIGYIIWVSDLKSVKNLDRYGTVHYISKRLHYVVMYVNADRAEEVLKQLDKQFFVRKVERSYRNELKTEYTKNTEDKTHFYSM
ncbi:YlbG family protein [Paenibacillus yanchengensis]|uniref:YlbG family protein n=1 Tax=Paenibacillus yanchengensis TaxID=2035833 RepID=A0ABW4YMP6_9BACL